MILWYIHTPFYLLWNLYMSQYKIYFCLYVFVVGCLFFLSVSSTSIGCSSGGGDDVSYVWYCIIPRRDHRPVIGNEILYLFITCWSSIKGLSRLIVLLSLDANAATIFNAFYLFIICLSSYSLITWVIFPSSHDTCLRYCFEHVMLLRMWMATHKQ